MKEKINQYDEDTGQRDGYWERYHDNGQLEYKGEYINGTENGWCESYWENGTICYRGKYVDGDEVGFWEECWNVNAKGGGFSTYYLRV